MNVTRFYHTATLLNDGRVFVTGGRNWNGSVSACELYTPDPDHQAGEWKLCRPLLFARERHTATLMPYGLVIVTGGIDQKPLPNCEAIDPYSDTSIVIESMNEGRYEHQATLLLDNRILVTGSKNYDMGLASCEIFAPLDMRSNGAPTGLSKAASFGTWRYTASMHVPRGRHTATRLLDGKVLVTGGVTNLSPTESCELYDPDKATWTEVESMHEPRTGHTATLLPDGRVLVTGGKGIEETVGSEIFDPSANGGKGSWTQIRPMSYARFNHAATYHPAGVVVVTGTWVKGHGASGSESILTDSTMLTRPWTLEWDMNSERCNHTSTLLNDGSILVTGGEINGSQDATSNCDRSNTLGPVTSVIGLASAGNFELSSAFPNPFASNTNITYRLDKPCNIRLSVKDMLGREIAVLASSSTSAGTFQTIWNGSTSTGTAAPGAYVIVLRAGDRSASRMVLKMR